MSGGGPKIHSRPARDERVLMALVRAAELFKRRSAAVFREHGLSFSQYNALRVLQAMPQGEASLSAVGGRMMVSKHNLSGIAKRLEAGGFVRRREARGDERVRLVALTPKGRRVLGAIAQDQEQNIAHLLAPCSRSQREALLAMLRDILAQG